MEKIEVRPYRYGQGDEGYAVKVGEYLFTITLDGYGSGPYWWLVKSMNFPVEVSVRVQNLTVAKSMPYLIVKLFEAGFAAGQEQTLQKPGPQPVPASRRGIVQHSQF